MLCDICGKNPATVHLTEIVDNQMNELHLCEGCAHQKSAQMEQHFGLSELLAGMMQAGKAGKEKGQETVDLKCPACQLSYDDFKKTGRLGCGECYTVFKKYLAPLIKSIHGSSTHFGKSPFDETKPALKKNEDIRELRLKLQEAVDKEDFEEAARLRDQIKDFESKQEAKCKEDRKDSPNGTK